MTQAASPAPDCAPPLPPDPRHGRPEPSFRPPQRRAGQWPIVLVMIVALIGCGLCRGWSSQWKDHNAGPHPLNAERGALGGMNSYSLVLMLGGLRGPLVMILWSKVENQKIDRDLEDIDTMIEWIRLLQPEFDTVHIFQIWNKAYNISSMMASTASKYTTILDAVDYARRVDADRPGDLNILDQLARVFGEKLGGANVTERVFYHRQFREDSMPDANRRKAYPEDDATYRRLGIKFFNGKNGPLLDANNDILPVLLKQRYPRPANLPAASEWNNGAELQYLAPYQPFPYGLPAVAMGYNYAKRAQVAMTVGGQKPLQLSEMVMDTYPPMLLKEWGEREEDRATVYELRAFGSQTDKAVISADKPDPAAAAAVSPPGARVLDRHALDEIVYGYPLSARLAAAAAQEFRRHLANPQYVNPYVTYSSHLAELAAQQAVTGADANYVKTFLPGTARPALFAAAEEGYREGLSDYERIVLTYYVEAALIPRVFPNQRIEVDKLPDQTLDQLYGKLLKAVRLSPPAMRQYEDQRNEYAAYINRCALRLQQLTGYGQKSILQTH